MTRTEEARRRALLLECGMGLEAMKRRKVCRVCGRGAAAERKACPDCGAPLPNETLYDVYKAMHLYCPCCGEVVTDDAAYCPQCGTALRIPKERGSPAEA